MLLGFNGFFCTSATPQGPAHGAVPSRPGLKPIKGQIKLAMGWGAAGLEPNTTLWSDVLPLSRLASWEPSHFLLSHLESPPESHLTSCWAILKRLLRATSLPTEPPWNASWEPPRFLLSHLTSYWATSLPTEPPWNASWVPSCPLKNLTEVWHISWNVARGCWITCEQLQKFYTFTYKEEQFRNTFQKCKKSWKFRKQSAVLKPIWDSHLFYYLSSLRTVPLNTSTII
jgi:hypothetical protein